MESLHQAQEVSVFEASKESRYSVTEGFSKVLSPYVAISKNFRLWLNLLGSFDRLWKPLPVRQVPTVPGGSGSVLDIATCGGGSHGNMTLSNGSSCRKIQHRNKGAVEFAKMFIAKSLTSFIIFLYVLSIRSTDFSSPILLQRCLSGRCFWFHSSVRRSSQGAVRKQNAGGLGKR